MISKTKMTLKEKYEVASRGLISSVVDLYPNIKSYEAELGEGVTVEDCLNLGLCYVLKTGRVVALELV